jgi:hypothetical protein
VIKHSFRPPEPAQVGRATYHTLASGVSSKKKTLGVVDLPMKCLKTMFLDICRSV